MKSTLSVYLAFVLLVTHLSSQTSQVLSYLDNRRKVHKDAINFCQDILRQKYVDWEAIFRSNLSQPIRDVDLVITVGGDGTLLQASHFMDDSVPVLGVNSDPTQAEEVSCLSISIPDLVTNMRWVYINQLILVMRLPMADLNKLHSFCCRWKNSAKSSMLQEAPAISVPQLSEMLNKYDYLLMRLMKPKFLLVCD